MTINEMVGNEREEVMKKLLILFVAIAVASLYMPSNLLAASDDYYAPIPVGSSANQVGSDNLPTKTDATNLRFFKHPQGEGPNFKRDEVMIGGNAHRVNDLVAVPGLLPEQVPEFSSDSEMIEHTSRMNGNIGNYNFFCPNSMTLEYNGDTYAGSFDCEIGWGFGAKQPIEEPVPGSRQLEIADVRLVDDFVALIGVESLLEDNIAGNASEDVQPYRADIYPTTIGEPFSWPGYEEVGNPVYDEVVTYGLAEIKGGIVTAAYDPLNISQRIKVCSGVEVNNTEIVECLAPLKQEFFARFPFVSPNIYFRKGERIKLSGYQSMKLPQLHQGQGAGLEVTNIISMLAYNFAPIDVREMKYKGASGSKMHARYTANASAAAYGSPTAQTTEGIISFRFEVIPEEGFVVVNQAPILSLDSQINLMLGGYTIDGSFRDGVNIGTTSTTDTVLVELGVECSDPLSKELFPHALVSYVNFWGPTPGHDWESGIRPEDMNPNDAFSAFKMGFTGGGMFDSAVVEDDGLKGKSWRLVVPAGEPVLSRAAPNKYYIYLLDPVRGKKLSFTTVTDGTSMDQAKPKDGCTPIPGTVVGEPYEVVPPAGFAPYGVDSADFNGDGCGDIVLTFRGAKTIALAEDFNNEKGEQVVFQQTDSEKMFSNTVRIYLGQSDSDGRCTGEFVHSKDNVITLSPDLDAQISDAKFADVDSDGKVDLVIGDLMPHKLGDTGQRLKWTGMAYICPHDVITGIGSCTKVRSGFATSIFGPSGGREADPGYLLDVATSTVDGIVGPGKLDAENAGLGSIGANIAAINGLPIALPPFGCPENGNVEVASPIELLIMPAIEDGILVPARCGGTPITSTGDECEEIPGVTNPTLWSTCCQDPCNPKCEILYKQLCVNIQNSSQAHQDCPLVQGAIGECPDGDVTPPIDENVDDAGEVTFPGGGWGDLTVPGGYNGPMCDNGLPGSSSLAADDPCCLSDRDIANRNIPTACCDSLTRADCLDGSETTHAPFCKYCNNYNLGDGTATIYVPSCDVKGFLNVPLDSDCCPDPCTSKCGIEYGDKCSGLTDTTPYCHDVKIARDRCIKHNVAPDVIKVVPKVFKLNSSKNDDDQADGGEDTDFAYRPDTVYSTKTAYIARADALVGVQYTNTKQAAVDAAARRIADVETEATGHVFEGSSDIFHGEVHDGSDLGYQGDMDTHLDDLEVVKPIAPRLPRGQVMPGPREMTVLVKAPLNPLCLNGVIDPGEACDPTVITQCSAGANSGVCMWDCTCRPENGSSCAEGSTCESGEICGDDSDCNMDMDTGICSCSEKPETSCDINDSTRNDDWDLTNACASGTHPIYPEIIGDPCLCEPDTPECVDDPASQCTSPNDEACGGGKCLIDCTCDNPDDNKASICGDHLIQTGEECEFEPSEMGAPTCGEGTFCQMCKCIDDDEVHIPNIEDPDGPVVVPSQVTVADDEVECRVLTASSEEMLEKLRADSLEFIGEPSGRTSDERFAEPQFEILCVGRVEGATIKASSIDEGIVQPYTTLLTKGTMLENISVVQRNITLVRTPVRVLPVAGEADVGMGVSAQVVLPQLSSDSEMAPILSEAIPMPVSSSSMADNGSEIINHMLQFSIQPVSSNQQLSISADASSSSPFGEIEASAQTVGSDTRGAALISWRFRLPADVASCPQCPDFRLPEGITVDDVANRVFDYQQMKMILSSEKSGPKPLSQIANLDVEWPENLHYEAVHIQQTLNVDSDVPVSKNLKFAFFGSYGSSVSGGSGGCGCVVANGAPDLGTTLPAILAFLFAGGGIAVGRIRRRKK